MRFISLLAVLLLLGACSTTPQETASVTTDGDIIVTDRAPITGLDVQNVETENFGPTSGTQQDLVVNVGDRVFFDYDQYDLRAPARSVIEKQAQWLKSYPNLKITIEGHCDERGTREYNLALGERRAMSTRNYMIALGISPDRISVISYGKERPAVVGADNASWAQNRRSVTIVE
jgi:peptidoglycan-associated lipoprotein